MKGLKKANNTLQEFSDLVESKQVSSHNQKNLRVGIDLGTSSIVLSVVNDKGKPMYGAFEYNESIRDGLVVDYVGAVTITRALKAKAEAALGTELVYAAAAVPPGTIGKNKEVVGHVLESAGFEVTCILDEPTAAANVLGITDGAVIDVGGGTTGISILKDGRVVYTVDEPTGGTHMNLVISGAYGISIPEAEAYKRNEANKRDVYATIRPVVEKMAAISKRALQEGGYEKGTPIVVVGGASNFEEFTKTFSQYIGLPVDKPLYPEFVTPLGIAMGSEH